VSALAILGFPADTHEAVLITIDKLDKVGQDGVVAELRERGAAPSAAVDALDEFFRRPTTMPDADGAVLPFGEAAIRKVLPEGVDPVAVAELASIGLAVEAGRAAASGEAAASTPLVQFDPWLVRGMGYYTGTIFEVAHPSVGYSLGGGGRYDGMIGRFLGAEVPAVGFSLGFERLVDLVSLVDDAAGDAVAILHDADADPTALVALKADLIAGGARVRLVRRPKNLATVLQQLADEGFSRYATVPSGPGSASASVAELDFRPLGGASARE
jgi:histidyl-tRNA synthetase